MSRPVTNRCYASHVLPTLLLVSLGMGCVYVPATLLATGGLPNEDQGLASGLFNTSQQIGGALGLAILSTLAASRTTHLVGGLGHSPSAAERASALVGGFHLAYLSGSCFMAAAGLMLAALLRRRHLAQLQAAEPVVASVAG